MSVTSMEQQSERSIDCGEKETRILVWQDNFNAPEIDRNKWDLSRLMNNPGVRYVNDSRHIRIDNSMLHMQTHYDDGQLTLCESCTTKTKMLFRYGYLEMRAKLPYRHGAWPSFWLLGNTPFHDESLGWFAEIDIIEVFSSYNCFSPNLHKWGKDIHEMLPGSEDGIWRRYKFENPEYLNDEFHLYGFLWDHECMKFFIDGECYYQVRIDEKSTFVSENCQGTQGFHEPAYIILNNEVFTSGLSWYPEGSLITEQDKFPVDYYVDWIRLYQNPEKEDVYFSDAIKNAEEI